MKFKVDENLPAELSEELRVAGHDAVTVTGQRLSGSKDSVLSEICRSENRILVTLDLDFADIRAYPPDQYPGLIVLRLARQDKPYVLDVFRKAMDIMGREPTKGRLWVVEERRIRIR